MIALKNLKMENLRFRLNSGHKLVSTCCMLIHYMFHQSVSTEVLKSQNLHLQASFIPQVMEYLGLSSNYFFKRYFVYLKQKCITFTIWLDLKMVVLVLINQKNILQLRIWKRFVFSVRQVSIKDVLQKPSNNQVAIVNTVSFMDKSSLVLEEFIR